MHMGEWIKQWKYARYHNGIRVFCLFNEEAICENVPLMKVNMNNIIYNVVNLKFSLDYLHVCITTKKKQID